MGVKLRVEDVIQINAPIEAVWAVTADVERWPEWTPTMESVQRLDDGPFQVGSRALIKQPGLPAGEWCVAAFTPGEFFSWESRNRGIRMKAEHQLTTKDGGTENLLAFEMFGIAATLIWPLMRSSVTRAITKENHGLRRHCEERSATG